MRFYLFVLTPLLGVVLIANFGLRRSTFPNMNVCMNSHKHSFSKRSCILHYTDFKTVSSLSRISGHGLPCTLELHNALQLSLTLMIRWVQPLVQRTVEWWVVSGVMSSQCLDHPLICLLSSCAMPNGLWHKGRIHFLFCISSSILNHHFFLFEFQIKCGQIVNKLSRFSPQLSYFRCTKGEKGAVCDNIT